MLFDPKKGGSIFDPPPLPQKPQKVGYKWGGLGGSRPKTHWGMHLLDNIIILQGVKLIIQPLGVGNANSPKKAKMGGGVFSSLYTPAWL